MQDPTEDEYLCQHDGEVARGGLEQKFPRLRGSYLNWQERSDMKLRWKVSKAVLLYRARQLFFISEDQYCAGVIRLNRGGEAKVEREDALGVGSARTPKPCGWGTQHHRLGLDAYFRSFVVRALLLAEFFAESLALPEDASSQPNSNVVSLAERRMIIGLDSERRRG